MCFMCLASGVGPSWSAFDHSDGASGATSVPESEAATGIVTGATGIRNIDALLSGRLWDGAITYSFPDAAADYEGGYAEATNGFSQITFNQMQAARYILEGFSPYGGGPRMGLTAVEQFTNLSISDAGFGGADLRIGESTSANPTAYAYYPSGTATGGDVWFGTRYDYGDPKLGT
jgi:serralysin